MAKKESRHIKLKFLKVCTKYDSKVLKILNYYTYGIPIGEKLFAEKMNSF